MSATLDVEPIRVCHIIHSLGAGGAEHVLVDMAKVALRARLELSVLSLMNAPAAVNEVELRRAGLTVRTLDLRTRWDPRAVNRATRYVQQLAPDVIHTHLKHADLIGAHVARRLGLPMVSTMHMIEDNTHLIGAMKSRWAARARDRYASRTIAVSSALRRWYTQEFSVDGRRVTVLYNGVVDEGYAAEQRAVVRAELQLGDEVAVLMVALFRNGKGHEDLLNAIKLIPVRTKVKFFLAGDGPLYRKTRRVVVGDPALRNRVKLLGYRSDIPALLRGADLVVHPAHADALPTALIHAAAAGIPSVATNVGGIPEIVTNESGRLVQPRDPAALAQAIQLLCEDATTRRILAEGARRRFEKELDATTWVRRLREIYLEVLE